MQAGNWWQRGIIYQVYPRSFQDSNGDGIGDLAGIRSRLDYLQSLGINAVWISPIYPSPMADFGYDVSDYCGIDPMFGTMDDFDHLVADAHRRGLKIILDFVPNHTSEQHPWFLESQSSRENRKRDWYLWRDPAPDGGPPNNWLSHFGGSAWEWDETTGQYYYHSFLKEQPDLNWRNPDVKAAMFDVLRFWMKRGVDGFRVDVLWLLIKDDQFRDNPPNPGYHAGESSHGRLIPFYTANRPEVHAIVAEMRSVLDQFSDRVLIGEIYLPIAQLVTYYGPDLTGAQLPFNFQLIDCAWSASAIAQIIREYEAALPLGAWPNWVLGNHDKSRIATRVGDAQARVAAVLLLTLRGTPTIYYGEEIGLRDVPVPASEVQDPAEKNEPGLGLGRDPERSPMPWDGSASAGFTTGKPWLPLIHDHATSNVSAYEEQGDSMLHLYRSLITLRQSSRALTDGAITDVSAHDGVLTYGRLFQQEAFIVCLNMTHQARQASAPQGTIVLSTRREREGEAVHGQIQLQPAEAIVVKMA